MKRAKRRAITMTLSVLLIVVVYTLLYHWGYETYEGTQISYADALQTVVESLTTAGFGGHAPWSTAIMNIFVTIMNLTGVLLFFITIPLVGIPYLRNILSEPPLTTNKEGHIVVVSNSSSEALMEELDKTENSYVFLERDKENASELYRDDISVVHADPTKRDGLEAANVGKADSIIVDVPNRESVTVLYLTRQINPSVRRVAITRDTKSEGYSRYAGADEIFNVAEEMGNIFSQHAVNLFSGEFEATISDHTELEVHRLIVFDDSPARGMNLKEFSERYLNGRDVIAGWFGSSFVISPDPKDKIESNSVLYITGGLDEKIEDTDIEPVRSPGGDRVLVCGNGRVGHATARDIERRGYKPVIVDLDESRDPDIVADINEPKTFEDMNVDQYRSVVIAIDDDVTATYACTILNNMYNDVKIVCRANNLESVQNLYLAGADQVVSLPRITGAYWSSLLGGFEGQYNPHSESVISTIVNDRFQHKTVNDTDIGRETGARVIAVESEDDNWVVEDIGSVELMKGQRLVLMGSRDELEDAETMLESSNPVPDIVSRDEIENQRN